MTTLAHPTTAEAQAWLTRWDRQQEGYIADREERFAVIGDVLEAGLGTPDPLIVDLAAGPGSLGVRLLERFPGAEVVAVDADPLLLGLARAAHGDRPRLRFAECDLRDGDWVVALGLHRPVDAIVSTTALHWLTAPELADVYERCAAALRPGGVFVNGDHLFDAPQRPQLDVIARAVGAARARRVGLGAREEWGAWWDAVGAAPELAGLVGDRGARPVDHHVEDLPSIDDHVRVLRRCGFAEVGTVWQHGDDRVLVAVR